MRDAIVQGENKYAEFKQSLRPNPATTSRYNNVRYDDIVVEIASFLNSNGGILVVGVANGHSISGLEYHDFNTFQQADKADTWRLNFDNVVRTYFGTCVALIDLHLLKVEGRTVAIITVKQRADAPVWLKNRTGQFTSAAVPARQNCKGKRPWHIFGLYGNNHKTHLW